MNENAEDRANFFITFCVRAGWVWGLKNKEGWRFLRAEQGREAFPVWPKKEQAQEAASQDEQAQAVSLDDWMQHWLPAMAKEGTRIAIHPQSGDDGVIIEAGELLEELSDEIEEMGG